MAQAQLYFTNIKVTLLTLLLYQHLNQFVSVVTSATLYGMRKFTSITDDNQLPLSIRSSFCTKLMCVCQVTTPKSILFICIITFLFYI